MKVPQNVFHSNIEKIQQQIHIIQYPTPISAIKWCDRHMNLKSYCISVKEWSNQNKTHSNCTFVYPLKPGCYLLKGGLFSKRFSLRLKSQKKGSESTLRSSIYQNKRCSGEWFGSYLRHLSQCDVLFEIMPPLLTYY